MLRAEITVNGKTVALIEAHNIKQLSDGPRDFIGNRATVCEYKVAVTPAHKGYCSTQAQELVVTHDRRAGWQGLLHTITGEITPPIIETITVAETES